MAFLLRVSDSIFAIHSATAWIFGSSKINWVVPGVWRANFSVVHGFCKVGDNVRERIFSRSYIFIAAVREATAPSHIRPSLRSALSTSSVHFLPQLIRRQFVNFPLGEKIGPGEIVIRCSRADLYTATASVPVGNPIHRTYPPSGRDTVVPFGKYLEIACWTI